MKNILLLTDFSKNAKNAMKYALAFFKGSTHHFFILNVQKVSNYTTGDLMSASPNSTVYDSIIKNPKAAIKKMIDTLQKEYIDEEYTFDGICDYDTFNSAVNQTVKSKKIDLIVMGTNGATGAAEVVFGSNTINVIRNVNCPVLAIPQEYTFSIPKSVLFATDINEKITEKSLKPLLYLASKFNSEIQILTLENNGNIDLSKEQKNKMNSFFKGYTNSFYSIENVPIYIAIDSFVQIKNVDITAKIINKESFFKRLISGSTTDEITYKSRVPLLIMHP